MTTVVLDVQDRATKTAAYDVDDIEYLRHGDKPLLARVFRPHGEGPFPALVEVHGGAWCLSDRKTEHLRHQYMARVAGATCRPAGSNPAIPSCARSSSRPTR